LTFQNGKETVQRHKILSDVLLYFLGREGGMAGLSLAAPQAVAYI